MSLKDYERDMEGCSRCASCKWVPFNQMRSWRFAKNCPSITRYDLHAYSGGGRMLMGLSMIKGRSELNDAIAEIIYKCQLCGSCDVACKVYRDDIDLTEVLLELRSTCVEQGKLLPEHIMIIDSLKKENNTLGEPKDKRGDWAEGLKVKNIDKEQVDVLFHAGCRYSYDQALWPTLRGTVEMLIGAGYDVGIAGAGESCCGGRAYEMGFKGEAENFADDMVSRVKASGARLLVTPCADGYSHFRYLYPRMGKTLPLEVLHADQVALKLVKEGKLELGSEVPMLVTWHDPCHLGRMSEPFIPPWKGDKVMRRVDMQRKGSNGVYDQPRELIEAIPGMQLVEMERRRQWSWCCGAGGGVYESDPDFCTWTALERIEEARATGAEAMLTSCPWCMAAFRDALEESGDSFPVYDLLDMVMESAGMSTGILTAARGGV